MPERTCSVDGCCAPHRARGLCSTHYNQQRQPERHRKSTTQCTWCGRACLKATTQRYAQRFCSLDCRDTWRRRDRLPVLYVGQAVRPDVRPARPKAPARPRTWVAGWCRTCGTPFVDQQADARSCSARCTRKYWRKVHADGVPPAVWTYVLERDGWRCQICKRGIPATMRVPHHKAGTVDHIVPRSQGGTHDAANLRAAHFVCNTLRSNRGGGEQLALIG